MKRIDKHKPNSKAIAKKLMASALALTICAPYIAEGLTNIPTAIIAHAVDGNGGGSDFGGGTGAGRFDGADYMALRLYVYNPKTEKIVEANGNQLIVDIMPTTLAYTYTNTLTTFGSAKKVPTKVLAGDYGLSDVLSDTFTKDTKGELAVYGKKFRDWMMTETGREDSLSHNVMYLLYQLFEADGVNALTPDCYVVVEPMFSFSDKKVNPELITWRAFVFDKYNSNITSIKNYMTISCTTGNGFQLEKGDTNIWLRSVNGDKLTMSKPAATLTPGTSMISRPIGYGLHLYSLEGILPNDDVINTYDIKDKPDHPSKSEKPSDPDTSKTVELPDKDNKLHEVELKNSGDTNVIKVYMDAYVDKQNSPDINKNYSGDELNKNYYTTKKKYTGIEQVGVYGTKSTTKEVVVQDEFSESGYHLVGWETSGKNWQVDGNKIVLDTGKNAWNGADWLQVKDSKLCINDERMKTISQLNNKNRARYNTTNITTSRSKIGTVEGADSVVNHKWDYKATDGAIVGK